MKHFEHPAELKSQTVSHPPACGGSISSAMHESRALRLSVSQQQARRDLLSTPYPASSRTLRALRPKLSARVKPGCMSRAVSDHPLNVSSSISLLLVRPWLWRGRQSPRAPPRCQVMGCDSWACVQEMRFVYEKGFPLLRDRAKSQTIESQYAVLIYPWQGAQAHSSCHIVICGGCAKCI